MEPNLVVQLPETTIAQSEATTFAGRVDLLVVDGIESHAYAQELLRKGKGIERNIIELCKPAKEAAHKAHRAACELERSLLDRISIPLKALNGKLALFETAQAVKAQAERLRLEAEAKKKAEDAALAEAEMLAEMGERELADQVLVEAAAAPLPFVEAPVNTAQVNGVTTRKTYSAEVRDMGALVTYVAAHQECLNLLAPNMPALNAMARSLRENMNVPGVLAVATLNKSVRL